MLGKLRRWLCTQDIPTGCLPSVHSGGEGQMSSILFQWVVAVLAYEVGSALVCDHVSCQVARTRTKNDLRWSMGVPVGVILC